MTFFDLVQTTTAGNGPRTLLGHAFADALPELALPWTAAEAPAPQLLALNDELAAELDLDPAALRTGPGLALLVVLVGGTWWLASLPSASQKRSLSTAGSRFW